MDSHKCSLPKPVRDEKINGFGRLVSWSALDMMAALLKAFCLESLSALVSTNSTGIL